ncbi:MAG: hypothetical protein OXH75_14225 [Acidobacteria bacterium]|nr:hypothetical protein [Acidobacteriota bacterium]
MTLVASTEKPQHGYRETGDGDAGTDDTPGKGGEVSADLDAPARRVDPTGFPCSPASLATATKASASSGFAPAWVRIFTAAWVSKVRVSLTVSA